MTKDVGAALAGYLSMIVLVLGFFWLAYAVLGADGVFEPASFDVTRTWIAVSTVLIAIASTIGGIVTVAARSHRRSVTLLAALVLVSGLLLTTQELNAPDDPTGGMRMAPVTNVEAMTYARQPGPIAIVYTLIGVAGVLFGAAIRRRPA